jgi:TPR repeat protein
MWLEPEDAAFVAARAIAGLVASNLEDEAELPPLPPQGEYRFSAADTPQRMAAATSDRFSAVEEAAHAGDPLAMHTLGLLHYNGVGGASWDERESAYWHAAAAAAGNVEALATLGGCVRRGVGALPDEPTGLAIIQACAAAGSPVGLVKLGMLHEEGELPGGLLADPIRAAQLFEQAAAARLGGHCRAAAAGVGGTGSDSETAGGSGRAGAGGEEGEGFGETVLPLKPRQSALGLFQHGFARMYGIGAPRDVQV